MSLLKAGIWWLLLGIVALALLLAIGCDQDEFKGNPPAYRVSSLEEAKTMAMAIRRESGFFITFAFIPASTGSMQRTLDEGTVCVAKWTPLQEVEEGDIAPSDNYLHRAVKGKKGGPFVSKGDAVQYPDPIPLDKNTYSGYKIIAIIRFKDVPLYPPHYLKLKDQRTIMILDE